MLQWFRLKASRIAATVIVAMAAVGGSAVAPHEDDCHDATCRSILVEHDAAAHRIGAASTADDNHPLHCLVCHWVRAFRPRIEVRFVSTLTADAGISVPVALFTISGRAPVAQPPLRSPPA
jgi:hypothetical protein